MKVILLKDVDSLGQAGEIVQVADGFARNALIPQHDALIATDVNVAHYESRRRLHDAAADREQRGAAELAQTLEKTSITAQVKVARVRTSKLRKPTGRLPGCGRYLISRCSSGLGNDSTE